MNPDLLFFCTMCREKTPEEIAQMSCVIEHRVKRYKRGEYIAYQGDRVTELYMLTRGRVKTEMIAASGVSLAVDELSAPYPLAVAFLFADNNRFPVDVIALEACELILIKRGAIEKQMARCPGFLRGFMAFNANRVQFLSERLRCFSQKGIKAKLAYYILQRVKNDRFELGRSVTSLAEYFAVERPSLSRCVSEMVRDGVIKFEAGQGKIIDYKALKDILE